MPTRRAWRASPRLLLPLLACSPSASSTGSAAHSVAQAYSFRIGEGGKVGVQMDIEFQVAAGAALSGSYKSILDSTKVKSIEGDRVTARDNLGRDVDVKLKDVKGWLQAEFTFPQTVTGDGHKKYTLSFQYTVLNGICSGIKDFRFYFPWAHRWIVPVTRSNYRIVLPEHADSATGMNEVCLGGTGFNRRCGSVGLAVEGTSAEHAAIGIPYGLFFQWPHGLLPNASSVGVRACPRCGAEDGCVAEETEAAENRAAATEGQMLPQAENIQTSSVSTAVVVLAIVLCCCFAVFSVLLRRKLHQWVPEKMEKEDGGAFEDDDKDPPRGCEEDDKDSPRAFVGDVELDEELEKMKSWGIPEEKGSMPHMQPSLESVHAAQMAHLWAQRRQDGVGTSDSGSTRSTPPPQSIGNSPATQGITIEIDDSPWLWPSSPPSSNPSAAVPPSSWEQAQRHWQGFGNYASFDSPSGSSSSAGSSSPQKAAEAEHTEDAHLLGVNGICLEQGDNSSHLSIEFASPQEAFRDYKEPIIDPQNESHLCISGSPGRGGGGGTSWTPFGHQKGLAPVHEEEDESEEELGAFVRAV